MALWLVYGIDRVACTRHCPDLYGHSRRTVHGQKIDLSPLNLDVHTDDAETRVREVPACDLLPRSAHGGSAA